MFAKRLLQKAVPQHNLPQADMTPADLNLQIPVHYGIPHTASIMAFDPIQHLLAIGTLDGRIKIVGGDNIEGLLLSPKKLPYKFLEIAQSIVGEQINHRFISFFIALNSVKLDRSPRGQLFKPKKC